MTARHASRSITKPSVVSRVQRREPRFSISVPVVTADGEPGVTKNMSLGGLYLITPRRYPVGDTMTLILRYADREVTVEARVTHLQADGAGFAFVDASEALRADVQRLIDDLFHQRRAEDTSPNRPNPQAVSWSRGDGGRGDASLRRLTPTGAFLTGAGEVSVGELVYVYLPGFTATDRSDRASQLRGVNARVVNQSHEGFEVRFVDPSAEFRMAVERLMSTSHNKKT